MRVVLGTCAIFFLLFVNRVQCDKRRALCFRILCASAFATGGVLAHLLRPQNGLAATACAELAEVRA
jgi:hypothetical protein